MNRILAWMLPVVVLTTGCRVCQQRTTAVVAPTPRPVFVRPADPVPVPNGPAFVPGPAPLVPGPAPVPGPGASALPGSTQAGFFTPGPNCNCDPKTGAPLPHISPPGSNPRALEAKPAPLATPPSVTPGAASPIQLYPPEPISEEKSRSGPQIPVPAGDKTPEPPRIPSTLLPAGIPQFTSVQGGIAAGLRPSLDDGLDWLQANGYKTVLHLRQPDEVNDADRKQVEKRGMKYLCLEISPTTLRRQTLEEFAALVQTQSLQPLFVYDHDGGLAGALWFWYFRTVDMLNTDEARLRAGPLGLRENRDALQRDMWSAVERILKER